jgi:hypothetical protein
MIVTKSGFEPDALELFRADEIGDIDLGSDGKPGDGAFEFWDGWGRPIAFKRWAPGFLPPYSLLQVADPTKAHDPMDPAGADRSAYALIPLVYSAGPDEATNDPNSGGMSGYGLETADVGLTALCTPVGGTLNGTPKTDGSASDNVSNHDLTRK